MDLFFLVKFIAICLGAIGLGLSFPGFDISILAWLCPSILFTVLNISNRLSAKIFYAFVFGFIYNLLTLNWLFTMHPLTWLGISNTESYFTSSLALFLTSIYSSTYFIIFSILYHFIDRVSNHNKNNISTITLLSFLWVIIFNKIGSNKFIFGFPWNLIEYSQYKNLFLIQIAEYFGSISIGFLLVFFNLALANIFSWFLNVEKIGKRYIAKKPGEFENLFNGILFSFLLIGFCLVIGIYSIKKKKHLYFNEKKSVVLLQGNLPINTTRGKNIDVDFAKKVYFKLISNTKGKLIIAPEGALPTNITQDKKTLSWIKKISNEFKTDIITGAYCMNEDKFSNCAVLYSKENDKFNFYEKQRLVPFGEFVPFYSILPYTLKKFVDSAIGTGFSEGILQQPFSTIRGKAGISICFELIFPEIIRKRTLDGANFLVNLSDLSWFHSILPKKQFIAIGCFRAIENRKSFIITTNNGISCFINPYGQIKMESTPESKDILKGNIYPNKIKTFYAKYGW